MQMMTAGCIAASLVMFGCSSASPNAAEEGASAGRNGATSCATPNEGCACPNPAETVECGKVQSQVGDSVRCSIGTRTCMADGTWGGCEGALTTKTISWSSVHLANLATSTSTCATNACDPYCAAYVDTPPGIDAGAGLQVTPDGLTLAPSGTFNITSCTGLAMTPAASTLTVTSIDPVTPDTVTFTANLTPPGCYPGVATPIWAVNDARADSVTITSSGNLGTLKVVSPIAGPVTVTAYLGPFTATATTQINVNVVDLTGAPSYAGFFPTPTGTGPDALTILYPYASTVFPLGLPPPIPQWKGGTAANAVKVSIRYVNGATSFQWAAITSENAPLTIVPPSVAIAAEPRYPSIPPAAWSAFERSAKGNDAAIVVQRVVGGVLKAEVPTAVHFANGQLRGNVYYQSYGTQLARNYIGSAIDSTSGSKVFPGGAFGAATLAIVPGATQPTVIAGSTGGNAPDGAGTYCRVCHTAAADGSVLITQKFGSGNATSQRYTNLTGTPTATDMSPGDGRFSWPAIFPTGGAANGFLFGNTGPTATYSGGAVPGGLDGSSSSLTSALYSLASATLGSAVPATYRTGGATPTTFALPSSSWGLQAALPTFSPNGNHLATQFYAGKVCNGGAMSANCTADELATGDKRSLATMDFDSATKRFSNFNVRVSEPDLPCNTSFHPTQPCYDVWPTFLPSDSGIVYEHEVFHNGNVGAASNLLNDYAGTRSGCDASGACSNDGTKAEIWWVNLTGAPSPTRLDAANGRSPGGASYLPVGPDQGGSCTVGGFSCSSSGQCCSGTCSNSRCTATKRTAGSACSAASDCEANVCNTSVCGCLRDADCAAGGTCALATHKCSGNAYYVPPAQPYVPGHGSIVEPVLNYEPTVNPTPTFDASGNPEYYWVVFTSRRMLGNIATIDPWWSDPRRHDLSQSVTPKKLWVTAVRANAAAGTDPSYPAFYLPGQEWIAGNSKAYWVQNACKAGSVVKSAATACDSNADCCAGSVCQLDVPVTNPANRYCATISACTNLGGTCSQSSDCCGGRICSAGSCQDPPPIPAYGSGAVYSRDFPSNCSAGLQAVWGYFDYQAILPAGTSIVFRARTAATAAALGAATPQVLLGTANPPSTTGWTSFPQKIDSLLKASGSRSQDFLRIEMQLNPTADTISAPTLTKWSAGVDCVPSE